MARPTKPKDLKPKADADVSPVPKLPGGAPPVDFKFIILLVLVVVLSIGGSAGASYVVGKFVLLPEIAKIQPGEHGETGTEPAPPDNPITEVGMNLELDEFLVALPQATAGEPGKHHLRAKISLNIHVPEEQNCYAKKEHASVPTELQGGGKIVGAAAPVDRTTIAQEHGGGEDPGAACQAEFKANMAKYVPTIRDIINGDLMKQSLTTLNTPDGQEQLKDQIKSDVSSIMGPDYSVIRVNFEDFITD